MDNQGKDKLRSFLESRLTQRGDKAGFRDDESLFLSGRLDSLEMTHLVLFLEQEFKISFAHVSFDVELIDSVSAIIAFADSGND